MKVDIALGSLFEEQCRRSYKMILCGSGTFPGSYDSNPWKWTIHMVTFMDSVYRFPWSREVVSHTVDISACLFFSLAVHTTIGRLWGIPSVAAGATKDVELLMSPPHMVATIRWRAWKAGGHVLRQPVRVDLGQSLLEVLISHSRQRLSWSSNRIMEEVYRKFFMRNLIVDVSYFPNF